MTKSLGCGFFRQTKLNLLLEAAFVLVNVFYQNKKPLFFPPKKLSYFPRVVLFLDFTVGEIQKIRQNPTSAYICCAKLTFDPFFMQLEGK